MPKDELQGNIYWADLPDYVLGSEPGKSRPVVVIQDNVPEISAADDVAVATSVLTTPVWPRRALDRSSLSSRGAPARRPGTCSPARTRCSASRFRVSGVAASDNGAVHHSLLYRPQPALSRL